MLEISDVKNINIHIFVTPSTFLQFIFSIKNHESAHIKLLSVERLYKEGTSQDAKGDIT